VAVISADSFDPLRRYVSVRMQQGVPLVDADWNEREDARRFATRSFLRSFAADGIPFENDAFRIDGTGAANDFMIRRGTPVPAGAPTGTPRINSEILSLTSGRTVASGADVLITVDVAFRQQPLHTALGAPATALAAALRVPVIAELPAGPGTVLVYLDVWDRPVGPAEDGSLVLPGLGTESCARLKREWAVRARAGVALPLSGDADFRIGHAYFELARIQRPAVPAIAAADVTDRRERALFVPPSSLLVDAFGTRGATTASVVSGYRRGATRPPVSYRDALNALMLGHLPGTADLELQLAAGRDFVLRPVPDGTGYVVAPMGSTRANPALFDFDLYLTRASLSNPDAGFEQPLQVTSGLSLAGAPQVLPLGAGDLLLLYGVEATRVAYRRGAYPAVATNPEAPPVATGDYSAPVVARVGTTAIFVFHDTVGGQWVSRRLNLTTSTWLDAAPVAFLPAVTSDAQSAVPVVDSTGTAWFAVRVGGGIQVRGITAAGAFVSTSPVLTGSGAPGEIELPALVVDTSGAVWAFYDHFTSGLWYATFRSGTWTTGFVPTSVPKDGAVAAVADPAGGGLWLTWSRSVGARTATYLNWFSERDQAWAQARPLTTTTTWDAFPSVYLEPNGGLWVTWTRYTDPATFTTRAYLKRVLTRI
jgi:hypothetical protein